MKDLFQQVLDWLFPRICEICGGEPLPDLYLCANCASEMNRPETPLCLRCGEPMSGAAADTGNCPHCKEHKHFFDFARACYINGGNARELVVNLKYLNKIYLSGTCGNLMAGLWKEYPEDLNGENWIIVPVPMHASKIKKRGYNQAEEIARYLAKMKGLPLKNLLTRKKDTISQTHLGREERHKHVRGLYRIKEKYFKNCELEGKKVLLIDDVMTTGSTAEACAEALKKGGVAKVGVLTVLRSTMMCSRKQT